MSKSAVIPAKAGMTEKVWFAVKYGFGGINMRNIIKVITLILFLILGTAQAAPKIKLVVSILPLKYLAERVGGDNVDVSALIGQGQNPELYEPQPTQISTLTKANVYYQIGIPFEQVWIKKIPSLNPQITIVDLRTHIKFIKAEGETDPHVWTSPIIAKQMAQDIRDSLIKLDQKSQNVYEQNYLALAKDLDNLDQEIKTKVAKIKIHTFLVFHPSWGYFADAYRLKQLAVEIEGKESGPQDIAAVMHQAEQEGIKVIFIQPQFGNTEAKALAGTMKIKVDTLDPLAYDYIGNLRLVAEKIAKWAE
jgi:zinc transport system substrate-binding protein